jgi:1,4-dihydroxy-2-naphthoate octaprenyltransferase
MYEIIMDKMDAIKALAPIMVLIGIITIAVVNRIKDLVKDLKGFLYTLMAMAIGAGIFAIFLYAAPIVLAFLFVGLLASGTFDITKEGIFSK